MLPGQREALPQPPASGSAPPGLGHYVNDGKSVLSSAPGFLWSLSSPGTPPGPHVRQRSAHSLDYFSVCPTARLSGLLPTDSFFLQSGAVTSDMAMAPGFVSLGAHGHTLLRRTHPGGNCSPWSVIKWEPVPSSPTPKQAQCGRRLGAPLWTGCRGVELWFSIPPPS